MKKYLYVIFATFIASLSINAEEKCVYFLDELKKAKTTWTAYKTPKKVGVNGTFTKISYLAQESEDLKKFLQSAKIEIETASVDSGLKERDDKLLKFFFKLLKKSVIKGEITNVKDDTVLVLLSMNNVKKEVSLKYTLLNDVITLTGEIDILNWSMEKSLASINKACYQLHEKKTWSDVALKIEVPIKHECQAKL